MMAGDGSSFSVAGGDLKYDLKQRVLAIHNATNWPQVVAGGHHWSREDGLNHEACCQPCDPHPPIVYPSIA